MTNERKNVLLKKFEIELFDLMLDHSFSKHEFFKHELETIIPVMPGDKSIKVYGYTNDLIKHLMDKLENLATECRWDMFDDEADYLLYLYAGIIQKVYRGDINTILQLLKNMVADINNIRK